MQDLWKRYNEAGLALSSGDPRLWAALLEAIAHPGGRPRALQLAADALVLALDDDLDSAAQAGPEVDDGGR